ncbi:dihydroxy-acid dehydratase domain-containing protein [Subtercola lobariae]|uniref:Dihydroxy-acid dehydratase n=1 Tax=Subtercola lobariae TaxID=1588641 RepID=A0A917B1D1_9MICO|nr:dihydroxy-acid dehydratase [Subtercola lobariae]GGF11794.1 dihydroxy-acid dehydratase [Subtercola lobariae]
MSQRDLVRGGASLFADDGPDGLLHRAFLRGEGLSADEVRRRPVIGICTSFSELNPCNAGLATLAQAVKRGIASRGGLGLEFPTISLSEPFSRPTSMYLRNLMSMDVEEMISSSPIDGVVLLAGCDKTVPAQLMGALSADKPAVMVTAGPRPTSCWHGEPMTIDDVWPLIDERRIGRLGDDEWLKLEGDLNVGVGTCNVLGTATTMAAIAEVLGFAVPGAALLLATSAAQNTLAERAGELIVDVVARDARPSTLVTLAALENAFRVVCALGGSTNAVIHLVALAGRAGLTLTVDTLRTWAATTPLLTDVRPSGRYLLADFERSGGVPALVRELAPLLDTSRPTVTGASWADTVTEAAQGSAQPARRGARNLGSRGGGSVERRNGAPAVPVPALRTLADPVAPAGGGLALLTGTLAPGGAVLKTSAASSALRQHRGRAVVFDGVADVNARIDDPALEVDASSILILRGVGVRGAMGMPEVGHIPIPAKLAKAGVTDMMRLTDARMSGTATGTVIVHITPEAAVGGPLAFVRDGDLIEVDVEAGRVDLLVGDDELAARRAATLSGHSSAPSAAASDAAGSSRAPTTSIPSRGFSWLHYQHVLQPDRGCDFDFLRADFSGGRAPALEGVTS